MQIIYVLQQLEKWIVKISMKDIRTASGNEYQKQTNKTLYRVT